jgi:hypothetical protein
MAKNHCASIEALSVRWRTSRVMARRAHSVCDRLSSVTLV